MNKQKQFLTDLKLLLQEYSSIEEIAKVLAKALGGRPSDHYSRLIRYEYKPESVSALFLQDFYKVFQADLDKLNEKTNPKDSTAAKLSTKAGDKKDYIGYLEETNERLQNMVSKLLEANSELTKKNAQMTQHIVDLLDLLAGNNDIDRYPDPSPQ